MTRTECIDAVHKYLDSKGWHYSDIEGLNTIECGFDLEPCKLKRTTVHLVFGEDCYVVYAISPLDAYTYDLEQTYRYLTRINSDMRDGSFELDESEAEIRYKSYVRTAELSSLPEAIIERSIAVPVSRLAKYGDGLAALSRGLSDADTEIEKARQD